MPHVEYGITWLSVSQPERDQKEKEAEQVVWRVPMTEVFPLCVLRTLVHITVEDTFPILTLQEEIPTSFEIHKNPTPATNALESTDLRVYNYNSIWDMDIWMRCVHLSTLG